MADEPIDLKKAITSPFTGIYWVKVVMIGLGLAFILFVGYGVYKAYFAKPHPTQDVSVSGVAAGGVGVNIVNQANKRHFIVFGEPYVFAEGGDDSRAGVGVKVGCRWEF